MNIYDKINRMADQPDTYEEKLYGILTQSSMMNSVKLIRDAATEEYKQTLAAIQEHGFVVSTKVGFFILAILIISFCGWMYCMAELVR